MYRLVPPTAPAGPATTHWPRGANVEVRKNNKDGDWIPATVSGAARDGPERRYKITLFGSNKAIEVRASDNRPRKVARLAKRMRSERCAVKPCGGEKKSSAETEGAASAETLPPQTTVLNTAACNEPKDISESVSMVDHHPDHVVNDPLHACSNDSEKHQLSANAKDPSSQSAHPSEHQDVKVDAPSSNSGSRSSIRRKRSSSSDDNKETAAAEMHSLEQKAYHDALSALYKSGSFLTWDQEASLSDMRAYLHISDDEHLLELKKLRSELKDM
ncbi:uncharacterized protein LOC109709074 [Ananas comosus]|uniref:Uncharacterized protein LOC109709074 n=1 Tax=Ananas comosus TaxID=4615 RepID=A0A6P5ET56_ANACO|nr:uncharacterized protein LOC109709074 [Ananas comosus]